MSDLPSNTGPSAASRVAVDVTGEDRLILVDLVRGLEAEAASARAQTRDIARRREEDVQRYEMRLAGLESRALAAEQRAAESQAAAQAALDELRRQLDGEHAATRATFEQAAQGLRDERDNLMAEVIRVRSRLADLETELADLDGRRAPRWPGSRRR